MENLLKKILKYEYIALDSNGKIVEISSGVQRFADCPEKVKFGEDVGESFPELIGLEETWKDIIQGKIANFELQGISRTSTSTDPLYLDISIFKNQADTQINGEIIILFEESTKEILQELRLSQVAKEYGLSISYLEQDNQSLYQIIDSMTDLLVVTNQIGVIQRVNQATLNVLGYQKEELLQQFISILFPSYNFPISFNPFNLLSQGKAAYHLEIYCRNKSGQDIPISFSCSQISVEGDHLQDLLWIGRNITEQKQLKDQLNQQIEWNHLLHQISQNIYKSFSLEEILDYTVDKIRSCLQRDWVMFYELYSDFLGAIVAESCSSTVTPEFKQIPDDVLIPRKFFPVLQKGQICKIEYTHFNKIDPDLRDQLTQFQIKSKLILPIKTYQHSSSNSAKNNLWGVLVIHQYNPAKVWEAREINWLQQLVIQIAIGIQKIDYFDQIQLENKELNNLNDNNLN